MVASCTNSRLIHIVASCTNSRLIHMVASCANSRIIHMVGSCTNNRLIYMVARVASCTNSRLNISIHWKYKCSSVIRNMRSSIYRSNLNCYWHKFRDNKLKKHIHVNPLAVQYVYFGTHFNWEEHNVRREAIATLITIVLLYVNWSLKVDEYNTIKNIVIVKMTTIAAPWQTFNAPRISSSVLAVR